MATSTGTGTFEPDRRDPPAWRLGPPQRLRRRASSGMCLLSVRSAAVLTFPKGVRALRCPFRQRYRLAQFGQGFMRVALVTDVPIVQVAVIGAAEETPLVANTRWLARLLRTPVAPLSPT